MAKKVLMKGNEAIAEAAIKSRLSAIIFGYPDNPSDRDFRAYMAKRMPKVGGTLPSG